MQPSAAGSCGIAAIEPPGCRLYVLGAIQRRHALHVPSPKAARSVPGDELFVGAAFGLAAALRPCPVLSESHLEFRWFPVTRRCLLANTQSTLTPIICKRSYSTGDGGETKAPLALPWGANRTFAAAGDPRRRACEPPRHARPGPRAGCFLAYTRGYSIPCRRRSPSATRASNTTALICSSATPSWRVR